MTFVYTNIWRGYDDVTKMWEYLKLYVIKWTIICDICHSPSNLYQCVGKFVIYSGFNDLLCTSTLSIKTSLTNTVGIITIFPSYLTTIIKAYGIISREDTYIFNV